MNKNTITKKQIDEIVKASTFEVVTVFDKCTVVAMRLPNGFVLVESSACVDPENYNRDIGVSICKERLIAKVWELEGYKLQERLSNRSKVLNCKICITNGHRNLRTGRIYEVKEGYFVEDSGCRFPIDEPLESVSDLREYLTRKGRNRFYGSNYNGLDNDFVVIVED